MWIPDIGLFNQIVVVVVVDVQPAGPPKRWAAVFSASDSAHGNYLNVNNSNSPSRPDVRSFHWYRKLAHEFASWKIVSDGYKHALIVAEQQTQGRGEGSCGPLAVA